MRYFLLLALGWLAGLAEILAAPICRIQRYDENDGLTQWRVTQMAQDRQGMMWFATWNGLCRYDGSSFVGVKARVGDGNDIAIDRVRSVWPDDDGNLTCRIDNGYYRLNLRTYRFEHAKAPGRNGTNAKSVKVERPYKYTDRQGVVWTVYNNGTLTYTDGGKETAYEGGRLDGANYCLPDRQGNLWVVAKGCVYKLNFPKSNGTVVRLSGQAEVKAFFVDRHKRYWIATKEDNTIAIYDRANRLVGYLSASGKVTKTKATAVAPIYCIMQTRNGTVWLGSKPGGLFRLREKAGAMDYSVERVGGLSCDDVYDIKEDRWGRLWVATLGGGVNCIVNPEGKTPTVLRPWTSLKGYPKTLAKKVRDIHITKDGVMLAAATDGLLVARLSPGSRVGGMVFRCHVREADRKDALSCSATMNVAEDSRGRLFVSTESGGVNMILTKDLTAGQLSFRHFNKEDNVLPTDVALSVTAFGKQLLMVGSNNIVLFNPDNGDNVSFNRNFFLSECRFSEAEPVMLPDGRWAFGLQDGLFVVAPQELRKSGFVPNIAFTAVSVQGVPRGYGINAADSIVLGKTERSMTLSIAALDFTPDADIRYAFALQNVGDGDSVKWNNIGGDHSVTLLDMSPGTYRLLVKSTNADGVWVDNVRGLTIVVTPTFWETTIAHVLMALLLLAMLAGGVYTYIYIRRIQRQRREALEAYLSLLNTGAESKATEEPKPLRPELSAEDDAMMRRVSAFVEEHIGDAEIGVGDMAEAAAVSRSGLQRKMKQITGVTPADFLKEARMKHASRLLSETAMTVAEVAYACGYSDPKYFSRSFKASTGKSPTEYRA